jgi:hypothetical protein
MTMGRHALAWLTAALVPVVACGSAPEDDREDVAAQAAAETVANGMEVNGMEVNGMEVNGRTLGSPGVWYARFAGATHPFSVFGITANVPLGVSLVDGELVGKFPENVGGNTLRGAQFRDVTFVGRGPTPRTKPLAASTTDEAEHAPLPGSTPPPPPTAEEIRAAIVKWVASRRTATEVAERDVPLRVVAAYAEAPADDFHTDRSQPLWHYRVEARNGTQWANYCPNDGLAIAVPNRWDYVQGKPGAGGIVHDATAFTFACDGAAISKCVERMKYRPWASGNEVDPDGSHAGLAPYLETCVRMVRADYCGNGISMTENGTKIDVFDNVRVNDPSSADLAVEARWGRHGATCGVQTRKFCMPVGTAVASFGVRAYIDAICQAPYETETTDHCGADPYLGIPSESGPPIGRPLPGTLTKIWTRRKAGLDYRRCLHIDVSERMEHAPLDTSATP